MPSLRKTIAKIMDSRGYVAQENYADYRWLVKLALPLISQEDAKKLLQVIGDEMI